MAHNTMNTNSKDVVKSVESNNVESTSNEQRQTNKPIVISRRRLLRAGVAGIPVVLTMAGVAPAAGIQTDPSAASGLIYGGNKVYNRFADDNNIVKDGLVWTDHNGFVLLNEGGVKTEGLTVTTDSSSSGETTFNITGEYTGTGTQPEDETPPTKTFTVSIDKPTSLSVNAYLHKTGVWYTDRIVTGTSKDLLKYIEELPLTIKDGSTELDSNKTNSLTTTPEEATFSSTGDDWYKTKVQGWNIEVTNQEQDYYLLPASTESNIESVNYNAKVSFSYTDGNYTYSCTDQAITIPLLLNVSGIPSQVNPGGI